MKPLKTIISALAIILFLAIPAARAACQNTATVSVTAAATTQIVSAANQPTIHVCGFSVSMSAAGTAQWVYGTGTNCGTGTTSLTPAVTLATGTPWTVWPSDGYVFVLPAGTSLCLAAVTGNVAGFVSWN